MMSKNLRATRRTARWAALLLALSLVVVTTAVSAQDGDGVLTDAEIAATLEAVEISRTETEANSRVVVELPARQDTYVSSSYPDSNYGKSTSLRIGFNSAGWGAQGALRPYIQFDMSSIPSTATINSAEIRVYQYLVAPAGDGEMSVSSRHLNSSWNENLVTWNNNRQIGRASCRERV